VDASLIKEYLLYYGILLGFRTNTTLGGEYVIDPVASRKPYA